MSDATRTDTPAPDESGNQEPTEEASSPNSTARRRWPTRLAVAFLALILLLSILGVAEARTSCLQSRWFSRLARDAPY